MTRISCDSASMVRACSACALGLAAIALLGCEPPTAAAEHWESVLVYGAPAPGARAGVLTYDPWEKTSFRVVPVGAPAIVRIEGMTVTCPPEVACVIDGRDELARKKASTVRIKAPNGQRVELVVGAPGYASVRVPIVLGERSHTRLVLLPAKEQTP